MLLGDTVVLIERACAKTRFQRNRVDFDVLNGEAFDVFTEGLPECLCTFTTHVLLGPLRTASRMQFLGLTLQWLYSSSKRCIII